MAKDNTAQLSSIMNPYTEDSALSENHLLENKSAPVGSICSKFPVAVWTPRMTPVVLGPSGVWAKALIEKMFALEKP